MIVFGVATGRFGPLPLAGSMALLGVLAAVLIPSRAPRSIVLSSDAILIRGFYRARNVRSEDIAAGIFTISLKEAGRPEHERFFDMRLSRTSGKPLIVGWVREGVVADLTNWLPHSKVTIRAIGVRGGVELHPRDITSLDPKPPAS